MKTCKFLLNYLNTSAFAALACGPIAAMNIEGQHPYPEHDSASNAMVVPSHQGFNGTPAAPTLILGGWLSKGRPNKNHEKLQELLKRKNPIISKNGQKEDCVRRLRELINKYDHEYYKESEPEEKQKITLILMNDIRELYEKLKQDDIVYFLDKLFIELDKFNFKMIPKEVVKNFLNLADELLQKNEIKHQEFVESMRELQRANKIHTDNSQAVIENTFQNLLITAEAYLWKSDKDVNQKDIWDGILKKMHLETLKNHTVEIHYLKVTDHEYRDKIDKYDLSSKKNYTLKNGDKDLISVIIFKPIDASLEKQVPIGIFNHGGEATKNLFVPKSRNPMFSAFAGLGYAIACPNYRGGSGKNHEEDMSAVITYLKQLEYVDSQKIVLAGISNGTTLNAAILDKPLANNLAGICLHTGLYKNRPDLLKIIERSPKENISVFLTNGGEDDNPNFDLDSTTEYINAFKNHLHDSFSSYVLNHGGHHLVKKINSDIPLYELRRKMPYNNKYLKNITDNIKEQFNAEETRKYVELLVKFLNKIAHRQSSGRQITKISATNKYGVPFKLVASQKKGSDIIEKVRLNMEIKSSMKMLSRDIKPAGPSALALDDIIKNAPYSLSLAHIKTLLKDDEFNLNDLESTVGHFLRKYDLESKEFGSGKSKIKKKRSNNVNLIDLIVKILKKEIEYKGSFSLYHAADSKVGYLYDVYSSFRRLFMIQGDIVRLRIIDDVFAGILSVEDLINKMRHFESDPAHKDTYFNYLPGYTDVGISAQWFLFGAYKYISCSTFFNYFLNDYSLTKVSIEELLKKFFEELGFADDHVDDIVRYYADVYYKHISPKSSSLRGGRLLQIFVSPSIINEVSYLSEYGGYPLDLQLEQQSQPSHAPRNILTLAVTSPEKFQSVLINNKVNFNRQSVEINNRQYYFQYNENLINCVEARFFMNPKHMDDPNKIQIFSYRPRAPYKNEEIEYTKTVDTLTETVASLLLDSLGEVCDKKIINDTPLAKLKAYVDRGDKSHNDSAFIGNIGAVKESNAGSDLHTNKFLKAAPSNSDCLREFVPDIEDGPVPATRNYLEKELKRALEETQLYRKDQSAKVSYVLDFRSAEDSPINFEEFFSLFLGKSPCFEPETLKEYMTKFVNKFYSPAAGRFDYIN